MNKKDYKCPFCHSHISKQQYDKVVRENKKLKGEIIRLKDLLHQNKEELKVIEKNIRSDERKKNGERFKALKLEVKRIREGKTAQEEGFDYENKLYGLLAQEFKHDDVKHTGKEGDVIISIKSRGEIIGKLLIEIKKVGKHKPEHIDEVIRHKIDAKADVGILVTNGDFGKNNKMDGFKNIDDILIIRPNSAIDFLKLLREYVVKMNNIKLSVKEKEKERIKLWNFIHSVEFENQMISIFRSIQNFQKLDKKELSILEKRKTIEESLIEAYNKINSGIKHT